MSNKLTKCMALAALAAAVGAWTSQAHATISYKLAIDGVTPGASTIDFSALSGGNVTLGLYADITGTNPGFVIGGGSFVLTCADGNAVATFATPTFNTGMNGYSSQVGNSYTASSFGGGTLTNWGSVDETTKSGYFYAAVTGGQDNPVMGATVKLASIVLNVSALDASKTLSVNFVARDRSSTVDQIWYEDFAAGTPHPTGAKNDLTVGNVVAGAAFTVTNSGGGGINVGAGLTVQLPETAGTRQTSEVLTVTESMTIGAGGTLDITNNDIIVNNGNMTQINGWLTTGCNGGVWDGTGITSAKVVADGGLTVVGVLSGTDYMSFLTDFDGTTVADTDVILKYTYAGDLNLDGIVDDNDLFQFLNFYSLEGPVEGMNYATGDINYDGIVDDNDLFAFLNNYPSADLGLSPLSAPVPEPASLGLLAMGALGLLARRRK